jgi:hypothetical protein
VKLEFTKFSDETPEFEREILVCSFVERNRPMMASGYITNDGCVFYEDLNDGFSWDLFRVNDPEESSLFDLSQFGWIYADKVKCSLKTR